MAKKKKTKRTRRRGGPIHYFRCDTCKSTQAVQFGDIQEGGHPMCADCEEEQSEVTYGEWKKLQPASPNFFKNKWGLGTMEEIAQVLAERTGRDIIEVRQALDATNPEQLWNSHVGPMLDAIQDEISLDSEEGEGDDLCDLCMTSGVQSYRTTHCGKTIGVECGCESTCDGTCGNPDCEECKKGKAKDSVGKKLYEFDMEVVVCRHEIYTVEAEDEEEARQKAERGQTKDEAFISEISVDRRTAVSEPTIVPEEHDHRAK